MLSLVGLGYVHPDGSVGLHLGVLESAKVEFVLCLQFAISASSVGHLVSPAGCLCNVNIVCDSPALAWPSLAAFVTAACSASPNDSRRYHFTRKERDAESGNDYFAVDLTP